MEYHASLLCCLCILINPSSGLGIPNIADIAESAGKALKDAGDAMGKAAGAAGDFLQGVDVQKHLDTAKDLSSQAGDALSNIDVSGMVDKTKDLAGAVKDQMFDTSDTMKELAGKAGSSLAGILNQNDFAARIKEYFETSMSAAVEGMKKELRAVLPNTEAEKCVPTEMATYEADDKSSICTSASTMMRCLDLKPDAKQYEDVIKAQFTGPRFSCQLGGGDTNAATAATTPRAAVAAAAAVAVVVAVHIL